MESGETFEVDGKLFRFDIQSDDQSDMPWDLGHDGHGEVTLRQRNTRSGQSPGKRAGERLLMSTGFNAYFYDYAGACRKALAEDWSYGDKSKAQWLAEGLTAKQIAANAAEDDFKRFVAWVNGDWAYVGAVVTLLDEDGKTPRPLYREALWGIESDAGDYFNEVADELAHEIINRMAG